MPREDVAQARVCSELWGRRGILQALEAQKGGVEGLQNARVQRGGVGREWGAEYS